MELPAYFTAYEEKIIRDRQFLQSKYAVIDKTHQLLHHLQESIEETLQAYPPDFPLPCDTASGKISKGDNYEHMPWLMSDYPRMFSRERIFAFRTLFWWGHHYAFNLHLEGDLLDNYRASLAKNLSLLEDSNFYLCRGASPWEYHFSEDAYLYLPQAEPGEAEALIQQHPFIKLSKPLMLDTPFDAVIREGIRSFLVLTKATGHYARRD